MSAAKSAINAQKREGKRGRGPGRTTREDWVEAAFETLVSKGEESVKILNLADNLGTTRSSFYWFFKNRNELLESLLDRWQETNTNAIIQTAAAPAESINLAIVNISRMWIAEQGFDTRLDFAIRDWARRSTAVNRAVEISDAARIAAIDGMFQRHGYASDEAEVRARVFYYTQVGYEAMGIKESLDDRFSRAANYMFCLSGQVPSEQEIQAILDVRKQLELG